jgi:hypothetical protein
VLDPYYYLPAGPGQAAMGREWCEQGSPLVTTSAYHSALNVSLPQPYSPATSWANPLANFDNVLVSIWTLFQVGVAWEAAACVKMPPVES